MEGSAIHPPFSPVILAGLLAKSIPLSVIDKVLEHIAANLKQNHPSVMNRLKEISGKTFLISPVDLPFAIKLDILGNEITSVATRDENIDCDVRIYGSIASLVKMLDGEVDGDALFFSRELIIEGDTEALLTLRNSMDADDIDIMQEMLDSFGLFGPVLERFAKPANDIYNRFSKDMSFLQESLLGAVLDNIEAQASYTNSINEKVKKLQSEQKKQQVKITKILRSKNSTEIKK